MAVEDPMCSGEYDEGSVHQMGFACTATGGAKKTFMSQASKSLVPDDYVNSLCVYVKAETL